MKYFGIKTPKTPEQESYIWWITGNKHESWNAFFQWPNKEGNRNYGSPTMYDAIRAYEGIGYKCVKLKVEEV